MNTTVEEVEPEDGANLSQIIESLIFAADKPLTIKDIARLARTNDAKEVKKSVAKLVADYETRGIVLDAVAGGYQFRTNPVTSGWVQDLIAGKPVRLSRAQLETLAICAYRQPVTKPEIDEIRGVDSGGTVRVLVERGLVRVLGRKEEVGRPMLYGTTKFFLEFFKLNDLEELPTLREFRELSSESMDMVRKLGFEEPRDDNYTRIEDEPEEGSEEALALEAAAAKKADAGVEVGGEPEEQPEQQDVAPEREASEAQEVEPEDEVAQEQDTAE